MKLRLSRLGGIGFVLLAALVVAVGAGVAGTGGPTDWPAPRADSANTGANIAASAPIDNVGPAWTVRVGTRGMGEIGPIAADGTVYLGNSEGILFAVDAERGSVDWRTDLGGSVESSAALDPNRIHVIVRDVERDIVELVSVERTDGDVAWRYAPATNRPHSVLRGHPVVVDGVVYVSGGAYGPDADPERFVVAVDDGAERWRFDMGTAGVTSPAVTGGIVYLGTYDPHGDTGRVVALDSAGGTVVWETSLDTQPARAPVIAEDEVYVVTWSDITVLDAVDGAIDRTLDVAAGGEAIAIAEDTVYAVRHDDSLIALDAVTGETRWTADYSWVSTAPSVAGNAVVVGADGSVVALDLATGEERWEYEISERLGIDAPPAVVDGAVFVGPADRRLYALAAGGSAVPGGPAGQIGRAILGDPLLGTLTAVGVASLLAGLVAGAVVLGLVRLLGYSWAPPRILASQLLRRPYEQVGRWTVIGVHFGLAVLALVAAGAIFLGGSTLLGGPAGVSVLGGGPLYVAALLLLGGAVAWVVFAYRWLPAAADVVDRPVRVLRRQAAVVGVVYALLTGPLFAFLLFLGMMLIFFR